MISMISIYLIKHPNPLKGELDVDETASLFSLPASGGEDIMFKV
jgi:hypothetical protein